jgi:hypothetical protein
MAADIYKKLSIHLAERSETVFEALKSQFESKTSLSHAVELLEGLLEKDLPHYAASSLPRWETIRQNRDAYQKRALLFLRENEMILYPILWDANVDSRQKESLFYLLARYLPESEAGCDALLRLGAIALYLSHSKIESPLGRLARQALCRYGLQAFASLSGLKLSCKTRPPYERIASLCKEEPEISPFRQIFFQTPSAELEAQAEEALKGLPPFVSQYFLATLPDWLEEQQRFKMESGGNEGAKAQNILIWH